VKALKAALFVLIAANTFYFALAETPSKGVDSVAWFTLLVLLVAETSFSDRLSRPYAKAILRTLRLVAAAGVLAATVGYLFEENTLDAANAALWILVVILLEIELRWPAVVASSPRFFKTAAAAAFGGLGLLVVMWLSHRMWFDAYDAALWLLAFGLIELDVTKGYATPAPASNH
jgi:hypothetical protein